MIADDIQDAWYDNDADMIPTGRVSKGSIIISNKVSVPDIDEYLCLLDEHGTVFQKGLPYRYDAVNSGISKLMNNADNFWLADLYSESTLEFDNKNPYIAAFKNGKIIYVPVTEELNVYPQITIDLSKVNFTINK